MLYFFAFGSYFGFNFRFQAGLFEVSESTREFADVVCWNDKSANTKNWMSLVLGIITVLVSTVMSELVEVSG